MLDLIMGISSSVFVGFGAYLWARVMIPRLADENKFFISPKLGRVVARRRSGKIVAFYSNLVGTGKSANEKSGKIEKKKEVHNGSWFSWSSWSWWRVFGAHFIGLDDVYTYRIATEATETTNGELTYAENEASSIFHVGSYPITAIYTSSDGVRFKVKIQLGLETVHAGIALSLPVSWTILVFRAVMAATRDYFGSKTAVEIIGGQFEGTVEANDKPELLQKILDLNTDTGNPALAKVCGQKIVTANFDIDFADDKTREQFTAPYKAILEATAAKEKAKGEANARIENAMGEMKSAEHLALAKLREGEAEANIMKALVIACDGDIERATRIMEAIKLQQMAGITTLVQGGAKTPISLPLK